LAENSTCRNGTILDLDAFEHMLPPKTERPKFIKWRYENSTTESFYICSHLDEFYYVCSETGSYNLKKFPAYCATHKQYFTTAGNMVGNHYKTHHQKSSQDSEGSPETSLNRKVKAKHTISSLSNEVQNLSLQVTDIEEEHIVFRKEISILREKELENPTKVAKKSKKETLDRILAEMDATDLNQQDIQSCKTIIKRLHETDLPPITGKAIGNICDIPKSDANRILSTIMMRRKWIDEVWEKAVRKYCFPPSN